MSYALHLGDCLSIMRGMPDCSIDAVITDPPYGLSKEPDAAEVLRHWLAGDSYEHGHAGFMGRRWDSFVPGPEYWREIYRVMKPGAHLLCFSGTRTWDLMSMAIRLAGFENRDTIAHMGVPALAWAHGQGFPKSTSISKQLDKTVGANREIVGVKSYAYPDTDRPSKKAETDGSRGCFGQEFLGSVQAVTAPATDAAKKWDGWHSALKPAWECILVFRKPLAAPTIAANVLQYSTGALNIDACRVAGASWSYPNGPGGCKSSEFHYKNRAETPAESHPAGRFPPNLLFSHVPPDADGQGGCRPVGTKRVRGSNGRAGGNVEHAAFGGGMKNRGNEFGYADPDGLETVAAFACAAGCPIAELDRQSGVRKSGGRTHRPGDAVVSNWRAMENRTDPNLRASDYERAPSEGTASRFFPCFSFAPDPPDVPFIYCAKAPKSERAGSSHPTQKPKTLLKHLIRLITPPGGTILDCFMGSGSTGIAAAELGGFSFVGIEQDETYFREAERRLQAALTGQRPLPLGAD